MAKNRYQRILFWVSRWFRFFGLRMNSEQKMYGELFSSEIFGFPQSIAANSLQLYSGAKSEIARRFTTSSEQAFDDNAGIVIELSPIIKSKQKTSCTIHLITLLRLFYKRRDIVVDRYFSGNLKEGTRKKRRDTGSTMNFTGETKFPDNFNNFLCNSSNKEKLG